MYKKCVHCNLELDFNNFYNNGKYSYCKKCESIRKKQQLINFKKQCLEYKNVFCCSICGYDKNIVALDFHHTDPDVKNFSISKIKNLYINQKIKMELDKCIVICSNCHRELHSLKEGIFTPKILHPRSQTLCINCGNICSYGAQKCVKCFNKSRVTKRPLKEQLIEDLKNMKYCTRIGLKYGVTSNAVKKWKIYYSIV